MKNRKTLLLLVLVAVAVWGLVVRRVVDYAVSADSPCPPVDGKKSNTRMREERLWLDYRDPFLGHGHDNMETGKFSGRVVRASSWTSQAPAFRMLGKIRKGAKDFLLLGMPGGNCLVPLNGQIEGFTVCRIYDDSVVVRSNHQNYTIRRE